VPAAGAARRCAAGEASRTSVSTSVFQALHERHCPSHRRKESPQAWQT